MNGKTLLMTCAALLTGFTVFAADQLAAEKVDMQKTAAAPEVQEQFNEPDGAAISLKEDGSFQIFARGTGTYDFDDVDDINDARREGALKARAALAKFIKERLSTEKGLSEAAQKLKTLTKDGEKQTSSVTLEKVKTSSQTIRNSADALLKGVITLKEQKIPHKGDSGEIQVTVGVSSKTLAAVSKLVNAIDSTPEQGQSGAGVNSASGSSSSSSGNKAETRKAVTDF